VVGLKKKKEAFTLARIQKDNAIANIRTYILENYDLEIGNLQAEIFLDFISENMGAYYYNQGVADSMTFMSEKVEDFYLLMKDEV